MRAVRVNCQITEVKQPRPVQPKFQETLIAMNIICVSESEVEILTFECKDVLLPPTFLGR